MNLRTAHWISVGSLALSVITFIYLISVHADYSKFKKMAIEDITRLNDIVDKWNQTW